MATTSPACSRFAVLSSSKVKFSFWIRVCLSIRNSLVLLLSNLTEYSCVIRTLLTFVIVRWILNNSRRRSRITGVGCNLYRDIS
jgi:hypothetical protein